jgi:hypothetical protein
VAPPSAVLLGGSEGSNKSESESLHGL